MAKHLILIPVPQRLVSLKGEYELPLSGSIVCLGDPSLTFPVARIIQTDLLAMQRVEWSLRSGSAGGAVGSELTIRVTAKLDIPAQGYSLRVTRTGIELNASTAQGAFYGSMTLRQILRQCEGALPACTISDHPDFAVRGVMLDVCRDKVPTLETLFQYVDELSELKINQLQLYTEHTFAYRNHPEVWAQASPLTGEDILRLDAYCRERFIELVPNQNSFGHMHRWFDIPKYLDLAECPEGSTAPWGGHFGPFTLDPTNPNSLALLEDLFADLLPHFTSRQFNVGCDETFDLGQGRSKTACDKKGKDRVYLEFLLKIHRLVRKHGRKMQFWGDIILQHPDLIPELPKDVIALNWGYDANHPYSKQCPLFAKSGIPFYVCPGTSTWAAIAGLSDNAVANIRNAAENGLRNGALGLLNTDWGDCGHWQYLPASYVGFAAGSALSWAFKVNRDVNLVDALDMHVFKDSSRSMGRLAYDLGNTGVRTNNPVNNRHLFWCLQRPFSPEVLKVGTPKQIRSAMAEIEASICSLERSRMNRSDAALIRDEFANAARMLLDACKRGLVAKQKAASRGSILELDSEMRIILGEHRRLWCARNRVGGLQDSAAILEQRLREYGELLK
ncbi:MAG TPA: family 20 glycosylhydrolase [bacterium]|nr:family 20 glycosylhydrolase [bacterium]